MKLCYAKHIVKDTECTQDARYYLLNDFTSISSARSSCHNCVVLFQNLRNIRSALPDPSEHCNEALEDAQERPVIYMGHMYRPLVLEKRIGEVMETVCVGECRKAAIETLN